MQKLVLLIDDKKNELAVLNEALTRSGIDNICTWACSPERAYALLQQALPDVILLDLNLQRTNSLECLEEIKKMQKMEQVPVILYSASMSEETKRRAMSSGAFSCVEKTYSVGSLANFVTNLLLQSPVANS